MVINDLIEKENIKIENMIYEIRGKQVMLDSDLAKLYHVETKRINEAVKNNMEKFPERFSFYITFDEYRNLRSKISTFDVSLRKYAPRVFTEQGVAMLATILKSKVATQVSIRIMDAFVAMRKYISTELMEHNKMLINHENRLTLLENVFDNFKEETNHIFYEGQIYDAYSLMRKIFGKAEESIVIIDNYIDKNILDILSKTNRKITIITNKYKIDDYEKYREQYNNVTLIVNNSFHDRFIIIDKKTLYHSGASFKDLGKKCFAITKIESKDILDGLLSKLKGGNNYQ